MTMPFGRYVGEELSTLDDGYLDWLLTIRLRQPLLNGVLDEIERRRLLAEAEGAELREAELHLAPEHAALAERVFDLGFKAAAKDLHPDRGGDLFAMQRLNQLRDCVQSQFKLLTGGAL